MITTRLTKTLVERTPLPKTGQLILRDTELKGFGVRFSGGGTRAFVVETRIEGKVKRISLGRYPALTVEEARREARKVLGEIASGRNPLAEKANQVASHLTLAQAWEDFKSVRKTLKPKTVFDYGRFLETAFPDWKHKPLTSITKDMVAKRHTQLGETRGQAYANHALRFVRALYNFARAQYDDANGDPLLPNNPVSRLSQTRAWYRVQRRRTVIKAHQLPAWLNAVEALRASGDPAGSAYSVADYLTVLLFTGLRRGEASRLTWDAVDLEGRTLTIEDTKNGEPLELPLSDYLVTLFARRKAALRGDYVFPGTGKHGYLVEPRKPMRRVIEASGVQFSLHDLRRTFITAAESIDIPIFAIKRLVNHKMHGDVTAGYIISDVERLRAPMQRITDFLLKAGKQRPSPVVAFKPAQVANSA